MILLWSFSFNNILSFESEDISHYHTNNKHNNHPSWALDYFYNEDISKDTDNNQLAFVQWFFYHIVDTWLLIGVEDQPYIKPRTTIPKSFFIYKTISLQSYCRQTKSIFQIMLQTNVYLNFSNWFVINRSAVRLRAGAPSLNKINVNYFCKLNLN